MMAEPYYGVPPAAAAPVAVVSPKFCAPYVVPLTVTKEISGLFSDGNFTVTDANDAVVLRSKGVGYLDRRVLLDTAGQPILSIQEKVKFFSMHNRWGFFRGDSSNARDLLFTVKKSMWLEAEMDILLASNTVEQLCDFKIKRSFLEMSWFFYLGNSKNMIAKMDHQISIQNDLLGKDIYSVTVFPHVDYVFIAAVVVVLDKIIRRH